MKPLPLALPRPLLERLTTRAIEEDIGRGDLTTDACVEPTQQAEARLVAREALVISGMPVAKAVFEQVEPSLRVHVHSEEGHELAKGESIATVQGEALGILRAERVALNFLQHLSGIATATRSYVRALPEGANTRIADTRKTTPGLRVLERYAVRCGGGHNHRADLGAGVLIKDNHIAAAGSVGQAVDRVRRHAPHTARIACEVDNLKQLDEALATGVDVVLLDNFALSDVETAVGKVAEVAGPQRRVLVEVSGSIQPESVGSLARCGVDVVSVGAITHSARAVDIALDWMSER